MAVTDVAGNLKIGMFKFNKSLPSNALVRYCPHQGMQVARAQKH